uniref:Uncharacterized protein n=1 Tax=Myotis myotis TaxID=51298 RepID=A0A7J7RV82_MYOMY|nr:hypothetical protein mMyoMyo1_010161 [Myotis myotis]
MPEYAASGRKQGTDRPEERGGDVSVTAPVPPIGWPSFHQLGLGVYLGMSGTVTSQLIPDQYIDAPRNSSGGWEGHPYPLDIKGNVVGAEADDPEGQGPSRLWPTGPPSSFDDRICPPVLAALTLRRLSARMQNPASPLPAQRLLLCPCFPWPFLSAPPAWAQRGGGGGRTGPG